ncbi:MAG: D-glycero-beta-D-manno-heptose 1-phosphate adenylyltransferase [Candidatus Omnitrophica bacterium]|nr:D-glycero-beta-D-manno-heptose 1-phosphate adenylyltransferase [Candidatus Omnitrophota bacterium]
MNRKLISLKKAKEIRARLRKQKKKLVFTNGCFDIVHVGHVRYLKAARRLGKVLLIGLNRDLSVRRLKGKGRPINSERERAEVLAALECVDYIVLFSEDTPRRLIAELLPDVLVKGSDWQRGQIVGEEIIDQHGGKVRRIKLAKGFSTTNMIKKIQRA